MILFDHECAHCGAVFEEFCKPDTAPLRVECPECHKIDFATRLIGAPRLDPKLGLDAGGFPTMGAKWERRRKSHQRIEEARHRKHGD